jgi:hypothetical protein
VQVRLSRIKAVKALLNRVSVIEFPRLLREV